MKFNKEFFDIIACPICKNQLELSITQDKLQCIHCKVQYPMLDNVITLIASMALPIDFHG
ncbi:MAG: Trm112 family protein [Nitrospirae bacterium]|nr:Trm112 family protein [Nitrospirota bacterium]